MEEKCSIEPIVDSLAPDSALQKKHIAMLNRLNARHLQKSNSSSSSTGPNSIQSFLDKFSESKRSIESSIECLQTDFTINGSVPQLKLDLEKISSSIAELEKFVAESSYLLPPYEVRAAMKAISDVKDSVEKASGKLLPRKKFSFRNKVTKKDCGGNLVRKVEQIKGTDPIPVERSTIVNDSPGFRNREGATLVKDFRISEENMGDFSLCNLNTCDIYLKGRFRALFVYNIRNSRVFVGPVLGSILIEDVEKCVFMLASQQIRIHEAKATDFYLRLRSRPIIEDCKGLRFGPYKLFYEGIKEELEDSGLEKDTGNWANVDDFRWLKSVHSPNWRLLEEKEQEGSVSISDIC